MDQVAYQIEKGLTWKEIKAKEPMLDQEEFEEFKLFLKTEEAKKMDQVGEGYAGAKHR